jgi:hypothetical protein
MRLMITMVLCFRAEDKARRATSTSEIKTDGEIGTDNHAARCFASAKVVTSNVEPEVR